MWFFNSKSRIGECGVFGNATDWHSHILPGVDDGVKTAEETLAILARYEQLGVKEMWLTPHIMEDIPNTTDGLRSRFNELCSLYEGSITLHLAAENMLDNLFDERLAANDLLPIGNGQRHLLVETSYFNPPMDLAGTIQRIKAKGYIPILAHPERYIYMQPDEYEELKEMGVEFQLNIGSLLHGYGHHAAANARTLLNKGFYDYWGTDLHNAAFLDFMLTQKIKKSELAKLPDNCGPEE